MNKIFVGNSKEICDLSGIKNIEQLKNDFNASGLVDVTAEREAKAAQDKAAAEATAAIEAPKEKLIQEKIRAMAILELQKEGKL